MAGVPRNRVQASETAADGRPAPASALFDRAVLTRRRFTDCGDACETVSPVHSGTPQAARDGPTASPDEAPSQRSWAALGRYIADAPRYL